jgi:N-acetylglucosaminyldiphosphoundecaprenol N-acetyl-beta-D-mannosaminyltransferase
MQKYFNVSLEFDHKELRNIINKTISNKVKGYVCVVDGNVLAHAYKNSYYRDIINGATANTCDGNSIAMLAGHIYKQKFSAYHGPDIFANYVKQGKYKQYFIGNTEENHEKLKARFKELNYNIDQFRFEALPFSDVNDFDYISIAKHINEFSPDIIWVSLGAPKQEYFIGKLFPYINQGILFAIGAAFNMYLGDDKYSRAPLWLRKIHLEWIYRLIKEPVRVGKRAWNYAILIPRLIIEEKRKLNSSTQ